MFRSLCKHLNIASLYGPLTPLNLNPEISLKNYILNSLDSSPKFFLELNPSLRRDIFFRTPLSFLIILTVVSPPLIMYKYVVSYVNPIYTPTGIDTKFLLKIYASKLPLKDI